MAKITVNGKEYGSLRKACEILGVKENSVHVKAERKGMTKAEALESLLPNAYKHYFEGKGYNNFEEICEEHNINYSNFCYVYYVLHEKNCDVYELLAELKGGKIYRKATVFEVDGVQYKNIKECAEAHGLNVNTLKKLLYTDKLPLEEAVKYKVRKRKTV